MADGSEFQIGLGVSGGDAAEKAAASLDKLASGLSQAGAASEAAATAMKAGQAAYDAAEKAALKASVAVEKIGAAASAQQGKAAAVAAEFGLFSPQFAKASEKLSALTARQAEAAAKATATAAAMNAEAVALDKLRGASSTAAAAEAKLGDAHQAAKKKISDSEKSLKDAANSQQKAIGAAGELEGAFGKLGGPLGLLGQRAVGAGGAFLKLGKQLGSAGPYVILAVAAVALAAGVAAVGVAAVGAAVRIGSWAVGLADAARTQGLLAAGIARTTAGGAALDRQIEEMTGRLPQTREELLALASPIAAAGLSGDALANALEEAAVKAAKLKFGPDFAKQMLSLPSQTARIQAGFSKIFSGLKIEALLVSMSKVTDLFKENSATANAAKAVFESLFQPLVDGVNAWIPKMVSAFIQFEILVLKALIKIKPFGQEILLVAEILGALALLVGGVVAAAIGLLVAGLGLMAVGIGIALTLLAAIGASFVYIAVSAVQAGAAVLEGIGAAFEWLTGLSLADIGMQLIQGLIDGIINGGPGVLGAITGIATGAIDAAKKALGIASPSKIFAEIGMHTAAGMEQGVDGGAAAVQGSMTAMVDPTAAVGAAGAAGAAGTSSSGGSGHVFNITVTGGADGESIAAQVRAAIQDLLTQSGGSLVAS